VRVFDKGRRVGGRVTTRVADEGRLHFDHGAQYFTAREPSFEAQTEDWVERGVARLWEGRIGVAERGRVAAKAQNPDRFVGTPGMSALAEDLARELAVESEVRVEQLRADDGSWRLIDDDGRSFQGFDAVVVAVPAPQAAPLVEASEALRARCEAAHMAPCWSVMTSFVLKLPVDHDGIFFGEGPLRWAARDSSKPHRIGSEDWVLHAREEWSAEHVEASPEDVATTLLRAFFEATGTDPYAPAFSKAHRWRYATPSPALDEGALFDRPHRLGLAGDWLYGARIEGAFISGQRIAQRVLDEA